MPGSYAVVSIKRLKLLREAGRALAESMANLGEKYLALCDLVRREQYTPEEFRHELQAAGLPDSRISEIRRVAMASDAIYNDFKNRLVGFKAALARARLEGIEQDEATKRDVLRRRKWHMAAAGLDRVWRQVGSPPDRSHWLNGHWFLFMDEQELKAGARREFRVGKFTVSVTAREHQKTSPGPKTKRKKRHV